MVNVHDIKKQLIFNDIDERDLHKIAQKLKEYHFKMGEYLYRENEDRKGFFLVHSGQVEVTHTSPEGLECSLFVRRPGEFCAALTVFGESKHVTNGRAVEDTTVFLFSREDFENLENEDVILAYQIMKNLAHIFSINSLAMSRKVCELTRSYYDKLISGMKLTL